MAKGECWTVSRRACTDYKLKWIASEPGKGASEKPETINTGQNSGYQVIELARLWGATRICLLGYDFSRHSGKTHWHGDHAGGLGNGGNYASWAMGMKVLADDLKKLNIEVVNCSRVTTLKCFPRSTITKELEGIK